MIVTRHAAIRYLQRVEGMTASEAEEAFADAYPRVRDAILTQAVRIACTRDLNMQVDIVTPRFRATIKGRNVVTIKLPRSCDDGSHYGKQAKTTRNRRLAKLADRRCPRTEPRRANWRREMEIDA